MATIFISDLHLSKNHPDITEQFQRFLQQEALAADAVYILGDLFDIWLGDEDKTTFNQYIIHLLARATQHVPIYVMHGNRDFLLGRRFAKASGCQLIPDPHVIHLYGKKILLKHGDDLCTDDKKHMQSIAFRHSWRAALLKRLLPLWVKRYYGPKIRQGSAMRKKEVDLAILDIPPAEIPKVMQKYQVTTFIHGHTHRPSIHYFYQNQTWHQHIVLSDWDDKKAHALYFYPNNKPPVLTDIS